MSSCRDREPRRVPGGAGERGQASLLMLAVVTLLLGGAVVFYAFGQALGAKGRHQRGADLAAVSAARVMRDLYPRLFQPPSLPTPLSQEMPKSRRRIC